MSTPIVQDLKTYGYLKQWTIPIPVTSCQFQESELTGIGVSVANNLPSTLLRSEVPK